MNLKSYHTGADFLDRYRLAGRLPLNVRRTGFERASLKTTPGLRDHAVESPAGSKWDAYEFVLLIAAHSERHTNQIKEVKADPTVV